VLRRRSTARLAIAAPENCNSVVFWLVHVTSLRVIATAITTAGSVCAAVYSYATSARLSTETAAGLIRMLSICWASAAVSARSQSRNATIFGSLAVALGHTIQ